MAGRKSVKWRDVVGYEGRYQVSERGRVRSLVCGGRYGYLKRKVPKAMKGHVRKADGYEYVSLRKDGALKVRSVHRVVLEAFSGPCPAGHTGSHLNGVSADNRLGNLQWEPHSANVLRKNEHGTMFRPQGELSGTAKLTEEEAQEVKVLCRTGLLSAGKIAAHYRVSATEVGRIATGERWGHL